MDQTLVFRTCHPRGSSYEPIMRFRRFIWLLLPLLLVAACSRDSAQANANSVDELNRLTKAWDAAFVSGLANSQSGKTEQACNDFREAAKLADQVATLARKVGTEELARTTLRDAKNVHRYANDECGANQ